jgi:hypothetical protein
MAYRGLTFGGLFEAIVAAVIFVLLTVLPWPLAIGLAVLGIAAVFLNVYVKGERHRRRVDRAERRAELQRDGIRGERERAEALRCRGGVIR